MRRAIVLAFFLLFTLVAPVAAAVPNDTVAGAITVAVPDTVDEDTSLADTFDPVETALNDFCGAPTVQHGVWFTIDGTDQLVAFDTMESDYSAGIMVFAGDPSGDTFITCGPGRVVADLFSGETYNVLVFGDGLTTETGGAMHLIVEEATPAPDIELTVDPRGSVDKAGVAHIGGTVTCTSTDGSGILFDVFGEVHQRVGRLILNGFFDTFLDLPCDGSTNRWDAFVPAENGLFAGGKAMTLSIAFGCTDICSDAFVQATVQLRRNNK
jgi:hypothetical protein